MTMGEKIQRLRKAKGMSQEELASNITVSRQAISKWELNEAVPDTNNIIQLCKIFGVSADYLLNDDIESDVDIPVVRENRSQMIRQYNRKLWVVLIGATVILSVIIGFINNSISTALVGVVFIGVVYLITLIAKALRKYSNK